MKRGGSDWFRFPHDEMWESGAIIPLDFTAAESGLFIFLAGLQNKFDGLPDHEPTLAMMCRRFRDFGKNWPRVKALFERDERGKLRNAWMTAEMSRADTAREGAADRKRRSRGSKGGVSRGSHADSVGHAGSHSDMPLRYGTVRDGTDSIPPTPLRGKRAKRAVVELPTVDEMLVEFPGLNTPAFRAAWETWAQYRLEINKPYKSPVGFRQQFKEIAGWGAQRAIRAMEHTMAKQWWGLKEPDTNGYATVPPRNVRGTLPYNPEND